MSRRGWVLFALMSVIWGMPYLFIKVADGGVSVPVLVFTRLAVAAALLLPLAIRGRQIAGLWRHWRWLVVFATVEMIIPWALLSDAERHLSSSMTGLLVASVPIIGVVLARLTGGPERLTVVRWAGLLIGLAGVAVLAGRDAVGGDARSVAEVLLVAVCYATGPLIVNRKLSELPGLGVNAFCLSFAAIVYAPAAALTWPATVPSAQVLASLAALGVICTALAFILFFKLIAEVGPARAVVITYVNPAVAVALGVAVLGEPLTAGIVAAFVLILAGWCWRPGPPALGASGRAGAGGRVGRRGGSPLVVVTGSASVHRCIGAPCVLCRRVRGWFVGGSWCARGMPRRRAPGSPQVVCRTARAGLRVTRGSGVGCWVCWCRRVICGRACWKSTRRGGPGRTARWSPIRNYAGNWPALGPARSGSWTPNEPGRCCAAIPTPGSLLSNAATKAIERRGSRGGGGR